MTVLSLFPIAVWYTGHDISNASLEVKRLSKCFSGKSEELSMLAMTTRFEHLISRKGTVSAPLHLIFEAIRNCEL